MIDWTTVTSVLMAIAIYKTVQLIQIVFGLSKKIIKNASCEENKTYCKHSPETIGGMTKCYPTHPVKYKCIKCGEYYSDPTAN